MFFKSKESTPEKSQKKAPARKRKGFFSNTLVEHPPRSIFIDYKEGLEKTILSNIESESHAVARDMNWGKSDITIFIAKVDKHPNLEPGYLYEIQKAGDGGSYLPALIDAFNDRSTKEVWIECTKKNWAFVELKNGSLETALSPVPPAENDVVLSVNNKPSKGGRPLYAQNYLFYYVSLILLFCSTLSLSGAAVFKYVLFDEEKRFIDRDNYTEQMYLPIDTLREARSTTTFMMSAIKFNAAKGWHFIVKEKSDNALVEYEQKVMKDGTLAGRVKLSEEPLGTEVDISGEGSTDNGLVNGEVKGGQ
jgi:hypothetical protein